MAKIRMMRANDAPAAARLANSEGWRLVPDDFRRMMALGGAGNFVAEGAGGRLVGIGTVLVYGSLAWLTNYIIEKRHRGMGIGSALVECSLAHADLAGVENVSLYTYDDRTGFYRQFGFSCTGSHTYYSGKPDARAPGWLQGNEKITVKRAICAKSLVQLDKAATGADRCAFLRALSKCPDVSILAATRKGPRGREQAAGYISAAHCPQNALEIGQWVAGDAETAGLLLRAVCAAIKPATLCAFAPDSNPTAGRILSAAGLKPGPKFARMSLGKKNQKLRGRLAYSMCALEAW